LDGNQGGQHSYEGEQRWRSERRASPSARPVSQSIPPRSHDMSGNGHYASPSLGGASASSSFGGYAGSNEGGPRRRLASSTSRSAASSIYGVNMVSSPSSGGIAAGSSSQDGYAAPADLPPVPPVPHLTQAHLRPGQGVSLLSHQKTLDMYRANVKKTNDPEITFELAQFMLGIAREMASMDNNDRSMLGGGGMHNGASEENLLSSLHDGDGSSSPSPDPSFSFHSRSSGSSGELASAAVAARRSSQGTSPSGQTGQRRSAHSPAPSMSGNGHRLQAVNMHRTGSPTSSSANVNDRRALIAEAISLLKRSADRGHTDSQYFLADIYAHGGFMGGGTSGSSNNNAASTSVAMGRRESSGNRLTSTRQSIYNLIPGAHHDKNNQQHAMGTSPGSASVTSLDIMRQNPSPTGSNISLSAPGMQHSASSHGLLSSASSQGTHIQANNSSRPDYDKALPLFIAAAKHGHAPSCYRAGQCFENGWGCRKDSTKAVSFYRKSAAASFPEAMYRLGMAELNGELGLKDRQKEGFKWLKQVAALAEGNNVNNDNSQDGNLTSSPSGGGGFALDDTDGSSHSNNNNNSSAARLCTVQALHELALLHERGIHNVVFVDNEYAAELLARASELGYAPSAYKLGECYEYGKMGCPQDAALSIHYYSEYSVFSRLSTWRIQKC
jgi:TPR repeat protein